MTMTSGPLLRLAIPAGGEHQRTSETSRIHDDRMNRRACVTDQPRPPAVRVLAAYLNLGHGHRAGLVHGASRS